MRLRGFVVVVGLLWQGPAALAADADEVPLEVSSDWRASDAGVDHRLTVPSAQTLGAGDVAINDYEIGGLGLSVGFTDWLQASITMGPFVPEASALSVSGAIKGRMVAARHVTAAVQAFVTGASGGGVVGGLALVDVHSADGVFSFSLATGVVAVFDEEGHSWGPSDDSPFLGVSGGPTFRLGRHVAFLVEFEGLVTLGGAGEDGKHVAFPATLNYGARFYNGTVALDLGALRPLEVDWDQVWALGFPYVGLSIRL